MTTLIPTFQSINELHEACTTSLTTTCHEFHVYRNEQAMESCRPVMSAHRAAFYQLGYDRKADYEMTIDGQTRLMIPGRLTFAAPGHTLSWRGGTGVWAGISVMFTAEFLGSMVSNAPFLRAFPFFQPQQYVCLAFKPEEERLIADLFERILYEYDMKDTYSFDVARHCLLTLLHWSRRLYDAQHPSAAPPRRNRAYDIAMTYEALVETHFLTYNRVGQYADHLCLTPKYLNEAVKAARGKTAYEVVSERVLREARMLLRQTNLPLGEIATGVGFSSLSQFSRFFRQKVGQAPLIYRQQPTLR